MTAPQPAATQSRFQTDFLTVALFGGTILAGIGAFVLTQQHEPIPGWLEAAVSGGLVSLGFYRAASPGQNGAVAAVAGSVAQLAEKVDVNHLDTMATLAAPTPPTGAVGGLAWGPGGGMSPMSRPGTGVWTATPSVGGAPLATGPGQTDVREPGNAGQQTPPEPPPPSPQDQLLDELHAQAAADAPQPPTPTPVVPPFVR